MPNWCNNVLLVSGAESDLKGFVLRARPSREIAEQRVNELPGAPRGEDEREIWIHSYLSRQPLTLQAFAAWPPEAKSESCWDAEFDEAPLLCLHPGPLPELATGEATLIYSFRTPWSPPLPVIAAMADQHAALRFTLRYAEPGDGFAGEALYADGRELCHDDLDLEAVMIELADKSHDLRAAHSLEQRMIATLHCSTRSRREQAELKRKAAAGNRTFGDRPDPLIARAQEIDPTRAICFSGFYAEEFPLPDGGAQRQLSSALVWAEAEGDDCVPDWAMQEAWPDLLPDWERLQAAAWERHPQRADDAPPSPAVEALLALLALQPTSDELIDALYRVFAAEVERTR